MDRTPQPALERETPAQPARVRIPPIPLVSVCAKCGWTGGNIGYGGYQHGKCPICDGRLVGRY